MTMTAQKIYRPYVFDGQSSFIERVDVDNDDLIVVMKTNDPGVFKRYKYKGLAHLYQDFILSLSLGEFYNQKIKGKYTPEKLD